MAADANPQIDKPLQRTPLHGLHQRLGARMVPFAGYDMPVNYPAGIVKEHLHTRAAAGLFDVSHMGQAVVSADDFEAAARAMEALVPADVLGLAPGAMRYSQLLNEAGGTIDDLMITRPAEPRRAGDLILVVNAARKYADYAHIAARLPAGANLVPCPDLALIALQGPAAAATLSHFAPQAAALRFLSARPMAVAGVACHVSRSGYTGEDGFEISLPAAGAERVAEALLAETEVLPVGLGARDTLRLEAGLCLYGHELTENISPVEAGLAWSIPRRRRIEGGFPGAARIQRELRDGPLRRRIGFILDGRSAAREGAEILSAAGELAGTVTSGAFSPSLEQAIGMGFVGRAIAPDETAAQVAIRGRPAPARLVAPPFVKTNYFRSHA